MCDALVDSWFDITYAVNNMMPSKYINSAFDGLPKGSDVLQLLAHHIAYDGKEANFPKLVPELAPAVVQLIAEVSVMERSLPVEDLNPEARGKEWYHVTV